MDNKIPEFWDENIVPYVAPITRSNNPQEIPIFSNPTIPLDRSTFEDLLQDNDDNYDDGIYDDDNISKDNILSEESKVLDWIKKMFVRLKDKNLTFEVDYDDKNNKKLLKSLSHLGFSIIKLKN